MQRERLQNAGRNAGLASPQRGCFAGEREGQEGKQEG